MTKPDRRRNRDPSSQTRACRTASQELGSASEITKRGPSARPTRLPPAYDILLSESERAVFSLPISTSKVSSPSGPGHRLRATP